MPAAGLMAFTPASWVSRTTGLLSLFLQRRSLAHQLIGLPGEGLALLFLGIRLLHQLHSFFFLFRDLSI